MAVNRQIILDNRPTGMPVETNFRIQESPLGKPKEDEVLVRTLYLSVDPYMRIRMREGPSYAAAFQIDQPLYGGGVGEVLESKSPRFNPGDIVQGFLEWADYSIVKASTLQKVDRNLGPITTAVGLLGMPGLTAYIGLLDIGKPRTGETVVISGAAGAVGMVVGQIAKIKGCRVIGIAGGRAKTSFLREELKFDAAIDYKVDNVEYELSQVCPSGVDIYFDNVGGEISDKVIERINPFARIVLCGQISSYNADNPNIGPRYGWKLIANNALMQGFMVYNYTQRFAEGIKQLATWLKEGKIKNREHIVEGLENTPKAFIGLFKGENIGKQLVHIADEVV